MLTFDFLDTGPGYSVDFTKDDVKNSQPTGYRRFSTKFFSLFRFCSSLCILEADCCIAEYPEVGRLVK